MCLVGFEVILFDVKNILQGGWEMDEKIEEAASREAVEEAGILGDLEVSK